MKEAQPGLVGGEPVTGLLFFLSAFSFFFLPLFVVLPVAAPPGVHDSDATTARFILFVVFFSRVCSLSFCIIHEAFLHLV